MSALTSGSGSGSLDWGVEAVGQLLDVRAASASECTGLCFTAQPRSPFAVVPPLEPGVGLEEALAIECGLFQAHLYSVASQGVRPKPFRSHPVEQPEVNCLCQLTIVCTDFFTPGETLGGEHMEVATFGVGGDHLRIAGDLGRDPKLYLRVVRDDEDAAFGRTDVASKGTASGDVLQVRVVAGHPPGGCP